MTTPTVQITPAINMVLGRPSLSPTMMHQSAPVVEPSLEQPPRDPTLAHLERLISATVILTRNLGIISLLRSRGVHGINPQTRSEEIWQRQQAIYQRLIVIPATERRLRADRRRCARGYPLERCGDPS